MSVFCLSQICGSRNQFVSDCFEEFLFVRVNQCVTEQRHGVVCHDDEIAAGLSSPEVVRHEVVNREIVLRSLILFSESALPRYESYTVLAGSPRSVTKQLYRYFPKSSPFSNSSSCLTCLPAAFGRFSTSCLTMTMRLGFSQSSA